MNVLVISGSRHPDGQTARAARALMEGVEAAGGRAEVVYLPQLHIEQCRQCDAEGWGPCLAECRCAVDDDLPALTAKVAAADAVVFATPVYFGDLSESMKTFLDRLRRTTLRDPGRSATKGKPAIGICVAGGSGGGAPSCCVSLERVLASSGFEVVDIVPVRRQNLDNKVEVLKLTGTWLARREA